MQNTALDLIAIAPIAPELSNLEPEKIELSFSNASFDIVKKQLSDHDGDTVQILTKIVNASFKTCFVMHRSIDDLMHRVGGCDVFSKLSSKSRANLTNRYNWIIKSVQGNERRLTTLSPVSYETLTKFEGAFDFKYLISNSAFLAMNARMGTGKTHFIGKPFCDAARAMGYMPIVIAHRVALISELSIAMAVVNYEDVKKGEREDEALKKGVAICINSLNNPNIKKLIAKTNGKYVLFIDEYNQTLSSFGDSTFTKTSAPVALALFCKLIKNSKSLIIADADMTDYSRKIAEHVRKQKSQAFFVDKDNSKIKFNITLQHGKDYENVMLLFGVITEYLLNREKAVFCSNRVKICQSLFASIKSSNPELRILLICSETAHDKNVIAFKSNSNEESEKYDLIIISPTITSGISVTNPSFKASFSAIDASTLSHLESIQQLHRFRCVDTHNVVLMTRKSSNSKQIFSLEQIANELEYTESELNTKDDFNRLITQIARDKALSRDNYSQFFISRITDLGYAVNVYDKIESQFYFDIEEHIKEIGIEKINRIVSTEKITFSEYNLIKQQENITDDDAYKILYFEICTAMNVPKNRKLDIPLLELFGENGRGLSTLRRNAMVFDAIDVDFMESNEIRNDFPINKRRFPRHVKTISHRLLESMFNEKIDLMRLIDSRKPLSFSNSTLKNFADLVEEIAPLSVIISLASKERTVKNFNEKVKETFKTVPIKALGRSRVAVDFLDRIGLNFKATSRLKRGGKDEHVYTLCIDSFMQIYEVFGWQSEKTALLKKLHEEKAKAAKAEKITTKTKNIDELNDDESDLLEIMIAATFAEYESAESGSFAYSCPKCYAPTNNHVCEYCDNIHLVRVIDIRAINPLTVRLGVFNTYKSYILN